MARRVAPRVARMMTSQHNDDIIDGGKEGGKKDDIITSSDDIIGGGIRNTLGQDTSHYIVKRGESNVRFVSFF